MLTAPWALWALLAVPIVFGIYFFRTRSRRREVSSLFLWVDRQQAKQGGRRLRRLQLPLLILLELLILTLLAVAAARPMIRIESMGRPTAIILDCSYSMTAGNGSDTARRRAVDDLHRMFEIQVGYPVQFVLAGVKAQLVSGRARNAAEARRILDDWTCDAPTADLDAAVSLTANVVTPGTKILVVTDRAPKGEIDEGKLLWKSYGRALDNFAIVHASRVYQDDKDRLLLEIANFSEKPQTLRMTVLDPKRKSVVFREERSIEGGDVHRLRAGIPDGVETVEVRLADDALSIDNLLTILPPNRRPVRVQVGDLPSDLAPKVRRAVEISGIGSLVRERPELRFDATADPATGSVWTVRIVEPTGENVKSFLGPFIVDPNSPVLTGLSLDGVVWSGDENPSLPGSAIVSVGDVPLLTEQTRRNGSKLFTLQLNDRLSTLTSSPDWPILIWNLLHDRARRTTGLVTNNLKLGTEAEFVPDESDRNLEIVPPRGASTTMPLSGSPVRISADRVGVYRLVSQSGPYEFAVGTLSTEESNLLPATTAVHGNWFDEETLRSDFRPAGWLFLLGALALLAIHHALISVKKNEKHGVPV